jgi:thiol-disulfide isomerase/thioredoxin
MYTSAFASVCALVAVAAAPNPGSEYGAWHRSGARLRTPERALEEFELAAAAQEPASRPAAAAPERLCALMVGDAAPPFVAKAWLKGGPVAALERGKVYVVDYWSTSGASCRLSIESLTKLSRKYGDKVVFIGVNGFEVHPDKVDDFLQQLGEKVGYAIALDDSNGPDPKGEVGSLSKSWMLAAGQRGVPASFLVAADGRVAFIGHPMAGLEKTIDRLLAGTFDFAVESKRYADELKPRVLLERIAKAKAAGDAPGQIAALQSLIECKPDTERQLGLDLVTLQFALKDYDAAYRWSARLVDGVYKDNANQLNEIAWLIVDPQGGLERRDLGLARKAVERALALLRETDPLYPGTLDTLARCHFHEGDLAKARAIQTRAVELCKDATMKETLRKALEEYRK